MENSLLKKVNIFHYFRGKNFSTASYPHDSDQKIHFQPLQLDKLKIVR